MKEEFVKELFELCKKHKVSIECGGKFVPQGTNSQYEIEITSWPIRKTEKAVIVYEVKPDDEVMFFMGDVDV